jgi:hypothetical protein
VVGRATSGAPGVLQHIELETRATIAGVDVGERFLDVALVTSGAREVLFTRVPLDEIAEGDADFVGRPRAIGTIAHRLRAAAPALTGAIAIVDSPAWPADLDLSKPGVTARDGNPREGREIDRVLRVLVAELRGTGTYPGLRPLGLFPTPGFDYFARRIMHDACKQHLRAIGRELFGPALEAGPTQLTGGTFTRFMIAGFAAHRALTMIGAAVYEGYPDLQFRLWCTTPYLPPKKGRKEKSGETRITAAAAFAARIRILERMAREAAFESCGEVKTLDAADAAILALSAALARDRGAVEMISVPAEGRFLVSLPVRLPSESIKQVE